MPNYVTDKTNLLNVPFDAIRNYVPYSKVSPPRPTGFSNEDVISRFSEFKMPDAGAFIPERLEIRGQSSKNDKDSRRITVLGKDRLHYKVFKMPGADCTRRTAEADEDIPMS